VSEPAPAQAIPNFADLGRERLRAREFSMPDFTLTAAGPTADSFLETPRMPRSEVGAEIVIAAGLFAAIAALFVLDPSSHDVDPGVFALCVGMLALSHAARIDLPNPRSSAARLGRRACC
jgi:hypothetical protein